ncbi:hypothetical protein [Myxosarcina sp. GI1]|nr:hypothetical protein [Myxosarcina sp. GI1]
MRSQIVKKLERAFFNKIESAYADQLANAIDILEEAIASTQDAE